MKNKHKKWLINVAISFALTGLAIVAFNYFTDYYKVFGLDLTTFIREPNQSFVKVNHILQNKEAYDSFIFGSSRVGYINPQRIPGGRFYNFTYAEGTPTEHLGILKVLLSKGVKVKNVWIGLDEFSYRLNPEKHLNDLLKKPYPDVSGENKLAFYAKYLFLPPRILDKRQFKQVEFDILNTGMTRQPDKEREITAAPEQHIHNAAFNRGVRFDGEYREQTIEEIRQIARLCRENNIKLVVFMNPVYEKTYLDNNDDDLKRFKAELASVTPYYDFCWLNPVAADKMMFYEASHYREIVGDMIIERILNKRSDFGIYVKGNVERKPQKG